MKILEVIKITSWVLLAIWFILSLVMNLPVDVGVGSICWIVILLFVGLSNFLYSFTSILYRYKQPQYDDESKEFIEFRRTAKILILIVSVFIVFAFVSIVIFYKEPIEIMCSLYFLIGLIFMSMACYNYLDKKFPNRRFSYGDKNSATQAVGKFTNILCFLLGLGIFIFGVFTIFI
jgi:uncharacterized membrane protein